MGNQVYNWTSNNTYILDGYVFLEAGGVLNIEAGTVIKGKAETTTGDASSALIITVGAQIYAMGTADNPIIFTAEDDDLEDSTDLLASDRGFWGGLILLGDAVIARPGGTDNIEGIPADQERARYGGTDNADNSGILRHISIRHGGDILDNGSEINGLTLGGVGNGTLIEYVEVFANDDDGIEFFGGTVDVKYATVAFCKDDGFDYDYGWRGRGQYWFSIHDSDLAGRGGEMDGASPDGQSPYAKPTIYNATYIGSGINSTPGEEGNDIGLLFRDNAGGLHYNSIITDFPNLALAIEDRTDTEQDAYNNLTQDSLALINNIWWAFGAGNTLEDVATLVDNGEIPLDDDKDLFSILTNSGNTLENPFLAGISRLTDGGLDPRPNGGSPALSGGSIPQDPFFDQITFRGAFNNQNNWLTGWTALDEYGYLGDLVIEQTTDCSNPIVIKDSDLVGGQTYNWTSDNCYLLDGYVFLEAGGVLNIEPGTVIKGKAETTTGDASSALIITVGAQIYAEGAPDNPIIFTAEDDDLDDDTDLFASDRGFWGGLILLGDAVIARPGGTDNIEGIPADQERARYGGTDNEDNSGVLRYISIRHGGDILDNGSEINGLTLGGVGSGTIIEYVEVFANDDDGIEFFGGTVDVKHAIVAFCKDDGFDYDYGWRGRGQFWFSIHDTDLAGRSAEMDGASPDGQAPYAKPTISNATYIGSGVSATPGEEGNDIGLLFRDNAGGFYYNSIFTDYPNLGLAIEDRLDTEEDAYNNFAQDSLALINNIWWNFGAGTELADFVTLVDNGEVPLDDDKDLVATLVADGNQSVDPLLGGISRDTDMGLDPRPADGPAIGNAISLDDPFFTPVNYHGAFDPAAALWANNWTAIYAYGYIGDILSSTEDRVKIEEGLTFEAPVPNPASFETSLKFSLDQSDNINLYIVDLNGRLIRTELANHYFGTGEHQYTFDVSNLAMGTYFVIMQNSNTVLTHKMIVTR
ncbi:hypothetical protein CRP01_05510 [Flavilitoribacter nigricans DSM 23189 = NBRC 102662]|uniref:Secretion system C-terminal sorting domain-containing protein n=2 Tax=Flavilitoribacter TaxID=2762562 RepID=A0A2D0NHS3_FLAN2|nr:hypothetical protein CRP01_05510 [Flavilitoribacter nigricans DSM 23189 = NBRC 102662]